MKLLSFIYKFLANGDADKMAAHNLHSSFTGNEAYWNPASK